MNADPPAMAKRPGDNAVLFEERLVADLQERPVERRRQAGGAGVVDDFRPAIGKRGAKIAAYRGQAKIGAEIAGAEDQRDDPRPARRYPGRRGYAGASLDERDHADAAGSDPVLRLGPRDEPVEAAHVLYG